MVVDPFDEQAISFFVLLREPEEARVVERERGAAGELFQEHDVVGRVAARARVRDDEDAQRPFAPHEGQHHLRRDARAAEQAQVLLVGRESREQVVGHVEEELRAARREDAAQAQRQGGVHVLLARKLRQVRDLRGFPVEPRDGGQRRLGFVALEEHAPVGDARNERAGEDLHRVGVVQPRREESACFGHDLEASRIFGRFGPRAPLGLVQAHAFEAVRDVAREGLQVGARLVRDLAALAERETQRADRAVLDGQGKPDEREPRPRVVHGRMARARRVGEGHARRDGERALRRAQRLGVARRRDDLDARAVGRNHADRAAHRAVPSLHFRKERLGDLVGGERARERAGERLRLLGALDRAASVFARAARGR